MAYDTVANVKSYLGLVGSTYDTFLGDALDYLSEQADRWTGRDFHGLTLGAGFNTHSVTETFFVDGEDTVILREWPVQSITSMTDDGVTLDLSKIVLNNNEGWLNFLDSTTNTPIPRWGKIEVTYVAGFTTVPAGLKMFLRRGSAYLLNRRMHEGVGADLLGDTQVTFRPARVANKATSELRDLFDESCGQYVLDYLADFRGVI